MAKTYILFLFGMFEDHEDIEYFCMEVLGQCKTITSLKYVIENSKNIIVIFDSKEPYNVLLDEVEPLVINENILFYFMFEKDGLVSTHIPESLKDLIFKPTSDIRKINIEYKHFEKPDINLDEILDKIEQHGIGSLTPDEKKFLEDFDKS
jgi:hypothetical protein